MDRVDWRGIAESIQGQLSFDVPLSRYTTLKTGGQASVLFVPESSADIRYVFQQIPPEYPVVFLGLGSNALVPDSGIQALVILLQGSGLSNIHHASEATPQMTVEAGVACSQLARAAARQGLTGMEFMAGIPGTVGGALAMNAGCHGGETWDIVSRVETINRLGQLNVREKAYFDIAYRQVDTKGEYFLAATFDLAIGEKATALAKIKHLLASRNATQPTNLPNCGSVFRNPVGDYAARLIEASGLKGVKKGAAQISEKHANFIVNLGGATTDDILCLIELMHDRVEHQFGISLEREVRLLGNA